MEPQLFDALTYCPASCSILSISANLLSFRHGAQAPDKRLKIDHYFFGRDKRPVASESDISDRVSITERGEWKPEYQSATAVYDLVAADLSRVKSELGAVIKSLCTALAENGILSCSIPLGWKRTQDHPYFLSVDTAVRIMGGYGLIPLEVSTVRDNVRGGYACHLICTLKLEHTTPLFDETRRLVKRYKFIPHTDPSFEFSGEWGSGGGNERIARDVAASFTWRGEATEVLIVCEHHQWSGIGEFLVRGKRTTKNLYSWYGHTQPEEVFFSKAGPLTIRLAGRPIGADPSSLGTELVIHGVLMR